MYMLWGGADLDAGGSDVGQNVCMVQQCMSCHVHVFMFIFSCSCSCSCAMLQYILHASPWT